jgi:uncharacterized membrane protein
MIEPEILMYERHNQPLIPRKQFYKRVGSHALIALAVLAVSLGIGVLGYHGFEKYSWLDSLLNASMILGGMGPVNTVVTEGGKVFASLYALFSGVVFLVVASVLVAPVAHRILHRMHMDDELQ